MTELLQPGFWALSQDDPAIWCPLGPQACLGGTIFNESLASCAPGFHGPLCGVAGPGAIVDSIEQSMMTCSASSTAVPVVLSIAGMILLAYVSIWRRPSSTNIVIDDDNDSREKGSPSDNHLHGMIILLYLSLQICSNLPAIFEVPFPASSTTLMQLAAAFSLASPQSFGWQCLSELMPSMSQLDHFELMQLAVALPAAAFLLLTTVVLGMHEALETEKAKLVSRNVRSKRRETRRLELDRVVYRQEVLWKRYTNAVTALYLVPLYGILRLTVSTFLCVDLSPKSDRELIVLYAQPNISCSGSGYDIARAWAVIALFVYAFLIPLLVVGFMKGWTGLTICWRWLTCSTPSDNDEEVDDVEEGPMDDENPPPPDVPPPPLPTDHANLYLFLFAFIIRFVFAVILPLLPGGIIAGGVSSNYGMVYDQRPTLPRALITVTILTIFYGAFAKLVVHVDDKQKQMVDIMLFQLILLSLAAIVLCQWPSFAESVPLDMLVLLTLLCSPLFLVKQSLLPQLTQFYVSRPKEEEVETKRKINYFAVRRLFMLAHGLSDSTRGQQTDEEQADDHDDNEEEKATSPYEEDLKDKNRFLAITSTEERKTFSGSLSSTIVTSTLESVPPPPPTSSPSPTTTATAAAAVLIDEQHKKRRMRPRPPPFPYGVAGPVIDEDGSSGGSWRWLAADDYGPNYNHRFYYQYDKECGSVCYGHSPAFSHPRPYYPPSVMQQQQQQQQLPPRNPTRFTPPRNNNHHHLHYRSPNSYYSRSSQYSSPQTSLSSMSSRSSSSCPTCEQQHRTMSSACVQLDDVYEDYAPQYLTNPHRIYPPVSRSRKLKGHTKSSHSSQSKSGSKRSNLHSDDRNAMTMSRSLIELSSSDSDHVGIRDNGEEEVDDGFRYEDAFELSPLKERKDRVAKTEKNVIEKVALKEDAEEEEEIIKRPWWHPMFLADAY